MATHKLTHGTKQKDILYLFYSPPKRYNFRPWKYSRHFQRTFFLGSIASSFHDTLPTPTEPPGSYIRSNNPNSFFFSPTDPEEVKNTVSSLKAKNSASIDQISTNIVKLFPFKVISIISYLINKSFSEGKFPDVYKLAKVVPIFKKGGKKTNYEDYRPISLLPAISKVIEKIVHKRLYKFLDKNNILYQNQLGFRKNVSTNHAASYVINKISENMNKNLYIL